MYFILSGKQYQENENGHKETYYTKCYRERFWPTFVTMDAFA
jgi:hypothetical protein